MKYFPEITTIEEMRSQFRKLCLKLHPDKKNGNTEAFRIMKAEYDTIIQRLSVKEAFSAKAENRETKYNYEKEKIIMEAIERLMIYFLNLTIFRPLNRRSKLRKRATFGKMYASTRSACSRSQS